MVCVSEGFLFFLFFSFFVWGGEGLTFAGWGEEEEPCLRFVEVVVEEVCMIPGEKVVVVVVECLFVWMEWWLQLVMRRVHRYYGRLWPQSRPVLYTDWILHIFKYNFYIASTSSPSDFHLVSLRHSPSIPV